MSDKKDLLEMDFGQVSIPQAIALSMQAATKCVTGIMSANGYEAYTKTDDDRLIDLIEKLEGHIQDQIDEAGKANLPTGEDAQNAPDEETVAWSDVVLMEDGSLLNLGGVVYQKACNEPVISQSGVGALESTFCIKRWGHKNPLHEDSEGREAN